MDSGAQCAPSAYALHHRGSDTPFTVRGQGSPAGGVAAPVVTLCGSPWVSPDNVGVEVELFTGLWPLISALAARTTA